MLTLKYFYIFEVKLDDEDEAKVHNYIEREKDHEIFEKNTQGPWLDMAVSQRANLLRYGDGPAQLRLFDQNELKGAGNTKKSVRKDGRDVALGDNVYSLLCDAPPFLGEDLFESVEDDEFIRVSVASLAVILIKDEYLLISQDEHFENTGIPLYIPLGGTLKYKDHMTDDLKARGAKKFDGVEGDMRFQITKKTLPAIEELLLSNGIKDTMVEPPIDALYRELREELTGFEDGASVFTTDDFPILRPK